LNNVNATGADHAAIVRMVQGSKAATAAGHTAEADQLLARAAQLAPGHPAVLNELGLRMMQRGDAAKARELFERAAQADPSSPSLWSNLAAALAELKLPHDELEAIERALRLEPRHLAALLQKGAFIAATGDARNAARIYRNALATIPAGATPPATVSEALARARAAVRADDEGLTAAIEQRLAGLRQQHAAADTRRVDKCLQILAGKRPRFVSQPTFMYFPELPAIEFFDRAESPWLDAVEAATQEIRTELTAVLVSDRAGLEPYIAYPEGQPLDQWKELNQSRRWSAYYLWNQGTANPAHIARCPRTMQALQRAPQCNVAGHGPTVFFSILDAHTHIPPHTGVTNTRLTVHLPLIVPPACSFRVGGETRAWEPGQAWVFDDTIEHEAWNRSDTPRAVLIFDIWNPFLSTAERDLVRAATEVFGSYYAATSPPESA